MVTDLMEKIEMVPLISITPKKKKCFFTKIAAQVLKTDHEFLITKLIGCTKNFYKKIQNKEEISKYGKVSLL